MAAPSEASGSPPPLSTLHLQPGGRTGSHHLRCREHRLTLIAGATWSQKPGILSEHPAMRKWCCGREKTEAAWRGRGTAETTGPGAEGALALLVLLGQHPFHTTTPSWPTGPNALC